MGRWISDDGLFYWDGAAWRPVGASAQPGAPPPLVAPAYGPPAAPRGRSPWPAILIGCGVVGVVLILLGIVFVVFVFSSPDLQRSFCEGYTNNNLNLYCPFSQPPATPSG